MNTDKKIHAADPALYRRLTAPFGSEEAFIYGVSEFATELRALREKYGMPDVVYVVSANVKGENTKAEGAEEEEGKEKSMIVWGNCGDASKVVPMLSHTLSQCVRGEVEALMSLLPGKPEPGE